MDPLQPQPGSTIDPRNAVGRDRVTERARNELRGGNNLSLNDPRRMGKTVWLDLFCDEPGDGFLAVKIDFEGVRTSEEFLLRAVGALSRHRNVPQQALTKLKALFDGVEVSGSVSVVSVKVGVSTRAPTDLLEQTIRSVEDHLDDDVLLVIAMDEVPIAMGNIAVNEDADAANQLLQTLRSLRRQGSRIRWIVCGSVGFHHVLRQCNATEGVVNDLVSLPLGPLTGIEAEELVRRLLLGIKRDADDAAVAAMLDHSGSIPFLIHALAHRLNDADVGPVSAEDVATAFTQFMDDRDGSRAVTHLVTRLDPLYGEDTAAAEALLDRVAMDGPTDVRNLSAEDALLNHLIDDHYLVEQRSSGALALRRPTTDLDASTETRMTTGGATLSRFTPSLMSHELLERLFVARQRTLDAVMARVDAAATSQERNHTLLVGPRGAGKTHLVSHRLPPGPAAPPCGREAAGGLVTRGPVDARLLPASAVGHRPASRARCRRRPSPVVPKSSKRSWPTERRPTDLSSSSSRTSIRSSPPSRTRANSASAICCKSTVR